MALINCPECNKEISDQCSACPHCGYPIKTSLHENEQSECVTSPRKPFYKRIWPWIIILVVIIAIGVSVIFLLNRNTKPKLDTEGSPIFVELTDEVYTNAAKYKGYYINIKGQVFQVVGDDGNSKSIQVWLDPETCEQNIIIHYTSGIALKQGDYISCSGYIDSVEKYKNTFGATMYAPVVRSSDLTQTTYIDVMAPTTATITPENLNQEKYGYSISVDKVEFSKKETRVYLTAKNNGSAKLYFGDAVIVQDGKQYEEINNFEAEYTEVPFEIVKGVSSSGIVLFPAIEENAFVLTIGVHSDNYDEEIDEFVFIISKYFCTIGSSTHQGGTSQETTVANRKEQAIAEVEELAESDYSRAEIKSQLTDYGRYTNDEADYAIQHANVDWTRSAILKIETMAGLADQNNVVTKKDCIDHLIEEEYTSITIQYAINNAFIDWSLLASNFVMNTDDKRIDYTWCATCKAIYGVYEYCPLCNGEVRISNTNGYTKEEIIAMLKQEGFSDNEISAGMQGYDDRFFYEESRYKKP